MKSLLISTGISVLLLVGCGGKVDFAKKSEKKVGENQASSDSNSEEEAVELSGAFGDSTALMLANATEFKINVVGCATGRTVTLTEIDSDGSLWLYDHGCVGKLESFTVEGLTYTLPAGADFNTYAVGGQATFEAPIPGTTLKSSLTVTVRKQIDSEITDKLKCQEVEYSFNSIDKRPGKDINPDEVGVKGKVVGEKLPDMQVHKAALVGISNAVASSGYGIFDFNVACSASLTIIDCKALIAAAAAGQTNIEYLLIKDNGDLTFAQAAALPWDPNQKVTIFQINSFDIKSVVGPGKLNDAANRKMQLVLKINGSFVYFPIDLQDIEDKGCLSGPVCPPCPSNCPL